MGFPDNPPFSSRSDLDFGWNLRHCREQDSIQQTRAGRGDCSGIASGQCRNPRQADMIALFRMRGTMVISVRW